jgi:hypothetical protein
VSMDKGKDARMFLRDNMAELSTPGAMLDTRIQIEQYQRYFAETIADMEDAVLSQIQADREGDKERATKLRERVLQLNQEAIDMLKRIKELMGDSDIA